MLPRGKYEPAADSELTSCYMMFAAAGAITIWGLASEEAMFFHYVLPPLAILLATARIKGWIPSHEGSREVDGFDREDERHEPAQGLERYLCYGLIVMATLVFCVSLLAGGMNWISVLAPVGMVLIATARLKGWVRRGSGGGGAGP